MAVRLRGHADANLPLARLGAFRNELHGCFSRRADALFKLVVAIATANWTNRFNDGLGTPLG